MIKDGVNNVKLTTEFLKVAGGDHGGSWAARIKGEPIDACLSKSPIASVIVLNRHFSETISNIHVVLLWS